jgi:uncharacterized membrane protein YhhN
MKRLALLLFFIVSLGELLSGLMHWRELHVVCKPLILITLGVYYWLKASRHRSAVVVVAIIFSFGGDTLLMFDTSDPIFFILGLVSFLISHIFYILAYRQHRIEKLTDGLQGIQRIRLAFPVILAGTGLVIVLYPVLGALRFPVMAYALVLVLMVLNALFRLGRTNSKSFWMVFGGALLFMISDSLLAINKFLQPLPQSGLLVMTTYITAQYLLVEGLCTHFLSPDKPSSIVSSETGKR